MARKLYGSVNNQAKQVKKIYGPVRELSDVSSSIITPSGTMIDSISDVALLNKLKSVPDVVSRVANGGGVTRIRVELNVMMGLTTMSIMLYDNTTYIYIESVPSGQPTWADCQTLCNSWGITLVSTAPSASRVDLIELANSYDYVSKEIKKLYGSVNGQTKLVYQAQ